jgi:hypothetical protein
MPPPVIGAVQLGSGLMAKAATCHESDKCGDSRSAFLMESQLQPPRRDIVGRLDAGFEGKRVFAMKTRVVSLSLLASFCLLLSVCAVAGDATLYDNGPINGNVDGWNLTAGSGFAVTDSFTLANRYSVEDISFGAFVVAGDTATTVEALFTTKAFGGSTLFDQVLNLTQSNCVASNNFPGFDVCQESALFKNTPLGPGTFWLQLQNANSTLSEGVYWDENSGVGCGGSDGKGSNCPSLAQESAVGTIPSESFTITGTPLAEPDGLMTLFGGGFLLLAGVALRKLKAFRPRA